jgi:pimeloyl-ACP methyl ester carboxylesterase
MALAQPHRVRRLVLSGAPCFTPEERARLAPLLGPRHLHADGTHLTHIWQQRTGVMPGWANLAAMHRGVVQSALAGDAGPWGFRALAAYDMPSRVPLLPQPVLFLTGTREGVHQATRRAHGLLPASQLVIIDGATQDVVDEFPDAFVGAVVSFLRR